MCVFCRPANGKLLSEVAAFAITFNVVVICTVGPEAREF